MKIVLLGFHNTMSKRQTIAGLIYLPFHIFVLPLLIGMYADYSLEPLNEMLLNAIYYGIGFIFCVIVMYKFLRLGFDLLLDNIGKVIISILISYLVYMALNYLVAALMLFSMGDGFSNPNNQSVMGLLSGNGMGPTLAVTVFLGPLVEECLFRGVLFGSLAEKHRKLAYLVSIAVFALYHIWQYALVAMDWQVLIYAFAYVPVAYVLARTYEQTNSIWSPIIMHMGINLFGIMSMSALMQ